MAVALLASSGPLVVLAGGPGQPSANKIPEVADGPDKVTLCTPCDAITAVMLKCQRSNNNDVRKCACIPNSEPGAWYGWIHNCRACLSNGNNEFFTTMSSTLSQLMVSCTNAGGSVTSDGTQICAGNAMFEACTALRDNSTESWATYENYKDKTGKGNTTFVLNLVDPYKPVEVVSTSTSVSVSPSATGSGSGNTEPTGTGSSAATQTEDPEKSAAGITRVGSMMVALVAVAFGALML
ncbi:hypothetical protein QBC38DRAFT_365760 [Podospora fimiseda]|uniref:Uncharacterized protein n=1 Tax=Podospora fimiseda TaxID=252190 RepID=A0AAN7BNN1_9PEZI|nr:hypothetical protein QBC38DRAFT_365760 [Podospora fimiseda]